MRIGFDISQTGQAKAGCGFFADGLIRALECVDRSNDYVLYPTVGDHFWDSGWETGTFIPKRPNFRRWDVPRDLESSRRFWRTPGDDFETLLGDPDVFHVNNFFCPRGLNRPRLIYTLYDLSFLTEPSWTTENNRVACLQGVFQASTLADMMIAISANTRRHFLSVFPHYPEERIPVIYPASRFAESRPVGRPERFANLQPGCFWLSVGTLEPRKNHARLLDAYRILKAGGQSTFPLVLAGGRGWLMDDFQKHFDGLTPDVDVMMPGYVSDEELEWLFRNCFGFVYPALFEGFGMPVLEALSLGAPVMCSNTSSLPEAAGDAAIYFDPSDAQSIAKAMSRLASGDADRAALKAAALQQAKRFSWASAAHGLLDLYREVTDMPRLGAAEVRVQHATA